LYRAGSLKTVSRELARYKLDLVGVQEVRWEGSGTEPAGECTFFYGKGNENHELGSFFLFKEEAKYYCLMIYTFINYVLNKELPDQWKKSIIVPVHKKDDKTD
jgi:hypothetical protein